MEVINNIIAIVLTVVVSICMIRIVFTHKDRNNKQNNNQIKREKDSCIIIDVDSIQLPEDYELGVNLILDYALIQEVPGCLKCKKVYDANEIVYEGFHFRHNFISYTKDGVTKELAEEYNDCWTWNRFITPELKLYVCKLIFAFNQLAKKQFIEDITYITLSSYQQLDLQGVKITHNHFKDQGID